MPMILDRSEARSGVRRRGAIVQRAFVTIAAIACLVMAIVTPPFQAADEYLHFYRAYQISEGQIVPTRRQGECSGYSRDFDDVLCLGGALPRSLLTSARGASAQDLRFDRDRKQDFASLRRLWSIPLDADDRQFLKFNTTGLHAPIGYLPQAIGIGIGRAVSFGHLPPIALMYLGRLANAAVWIAAVRLAMAIAPEFLLGWLAIGLLPMALFQAASLSADVLTNALACAIVAAVWRARSRPFASAIAPGILSIVVVVFSVSKLAYVPMGLLLCLIPARSFASLRRRSDRGTRGLRWMWLSATASLAIACVLGWSRIVDRIYVPLHPDLDPTSQIAGILADPLGFAGTAIATLTDDAGRYLHQFVGVFGWLDTPLPRLHVGLYLAFAIVAIVSRRPRDRREARRLPMTIVDRAIVAAALLGSIGLLCVLAYLWNVVGADRIGGIQGRYFIPLAPLLLPLGPSFVTPLSRNPIGGIFIAIGSVLSATVAIVVRYYALGV